MIVKTGDWNLAIKLSFGAAARFPGACGIALRRAATRIKRNIKSNITKGPPPPHSPLTRATGGRGKPLTRHGDMRNSVNVVKLETLAYFIGIPRSASSYTIAEIQENGAIVVQRMSERMRGFLHARLRKVGPPPIGETGIVVSQIPARPFIQPAYEQESLTFEQEFASDFAKALRGDYGTVGTR